MLIVCFHASSRERTEERNNKTILCDRYPNIRLVAITQKNFVDSYHYLLIVYLMDEFIIEFLLHNNLYINSNKTYYIYKHFDSCFIIHNSGEQNFVHDRMIVDNKNLN